MSCRLLGHWPDLFSIGVWANFNWLCQPVKEQDKAKVKFFLYSKQQKAITVYHKYIDTYVPAAAAAVSVFFSTKERHFKLIP